MLELPPLVFGTQANGPAVKRTRIKVCGITQVEDAMAAVAAGADAIGLVFWEPSPRSVSIKQAEIICAEIPAFISVVALTVDADASFVKQLLSRLPVDLLQFHGNETAEHCEQFCKPYMKAIRMRPGLDVVQSLADYSTACSVLLDAYRKGIPGGTGESFVWETIPRQCRSRIVLAGGLNASNVGAAITSIRPYAVDVSGGVESSPGIKSTNKIVEFASQVRLADINSDII